LFSLEQSLNKVVFKTFANFNQQGGPI